MTTPSYTYNARFTAPDAPSSARKGYPDPTQRTNRIFRHDDHKFEWETDEFEQWVNAAAETWGYSVHWASIGRSEQKDPYGREDELGGASFVAEFRKLRDNTMTDEQREKMGRETVKRLTAEAAGPISSTPHELLAHHHHPAHPLSKKPRGLPEIAQLVKARMEDNREGIKGLEEVWYQTGVAIACGGWLEVLVQAIEESPELVLKKDEDGLVRKRDLWSVELIGADWNDEETSDDMPADWIPGEGSLELTDYSDVGDESTGVEADVSLSEEDSSKTAWSPHWSSGTDWGRKPKRRSSWAGYGSRDEDSDSWTDGWGTNSVGGGWGGVPEDHKKHKRPANQWGAPTHTKKDRDRNEGDSSTAGWDGDADSDTE
jgi:small RNA 2'-O-methyltransferase